MIRFIDSILYKSNFQISSHVYFNYKLKIILCYAYITSFFFVEKIYLKKKLFFSRRDHQATSRNRKNWTMSRYACPLLTEHPDQVSMLLVVPTVNQITQSLWPPPLLLFRLLALHLKQSHWELITLVVGPCLPS